MGDFLFIAVVITLVDLNKPQDIVSGNGKKWAGN